jgi:AraC-like DNA-binding protein
VSHRGIARLLRQAARGIRWVGPAAQRGAKLLDEVFACHGPRRIAALLGLLDFLATARGGRPLAGGGYRLAPDQASSVRINRALQLVHANLTGDIHAVQAAKLAGLSLSGFHRFFRRCIGRSFIDYIIEQRLSMARRLLLATDLTVVEVCFSFGFGNLSNFNRHFRARCGRAPALWRLEATSG